MSEPTEAAEAAPEPTAAPAPSPAAEAASESTHATPSPEVAPPQGRARPEVWQGHKKTHHAIHAAAAFAHGWAGTSPRLTEQEYDEAIAKVQDAELGHATFDPPARNYFQPPPAGRPRQVHTRATLSQAALRGGRA